jgi:hypothetical protein
VVSPMYGRIIQSSAPLRLAIVEGLDVGKVRSRYMLRQARNYWSSGETKDRRALARPDQVVPNPALVQRPEGWVQTDQRKG